MIEQYLTEERIALNLKAVNWRDLVDKVGKIMLDAGDIEPTYINAMKEIIEEMGPYAVIAPGVVLLHARPEHGVKRISFVMATIQDGIDFGSKNDPVKLAIGLGALDHEGHIELLRDLSIFLQNKEKLSMIYKAKTKKEFIQIIKNT